MAYWKGSRNYTDSTFTNGEILSKLALAFSSLVCIVNGILLYTLSFNNSYRIPYELSMHSLDRDSELFENGITDEVFTKTHGIFVIVSSATQDLSIVRTCTVEFAILEECWER